MIENPQFSPDGRRLVVAISRRGGEPPNLWVYDLQGGGDPTGLTFDGGRAPIWSLDGATVTYSHLGERQGIYSKPVDGRADATRLLALDAFHWLVGWTPDRRTLAYGRMEGTASSILAFSEAQSRHVVGPDQRGVDDCPTMGGGSPITCSSRVTLVCVTPFPESGTRWLIAEGTDPTWGPDDAEVYYRSGARLMAARIDTTSGIRVLSHRLIVEPFLPPLYDDYDIHPKDGRLVMVRPAGATRAREVTMVLDWFTELRRLARTP